jgi:hypothetical protein
MTVSRKISPWKRFRSDIPNPKNYEHAVERRENGVRGECSSDDLQNSQRAFEMVGFADEAKKSLNGYLVPQGPIPYQAQLPEHR